MILLTMTTADKIQTVILVLTIIGLIITIYNNKKQLEMFNRQLKLNFFADYTKRYQEIILNFPENINRNDFDYNNLTNDQKEKTFRMMRAYFDLCSEEYDLYKEGYIEAKTWEKWEDGIKFALSKEAFQVAWDKISVDTCYYKDFKTWVDNVIKNNP